MSWEVLRALSYLETYAHVLGNDDREAAEQAAEFLLGDAWDIDAENGPG